ncbi:dethiobiotin synthase [Desulfocurvus sp. DL9XJH121]
MSALPSRVFVTGTDTDIGKTVICALLMAGRGGYYWKPIQSGTREGTDTRGVCRMSGLPGERCLPEAYSLREPLSPHEAAERDGVCIDISHLCVPELPQGAPLVVEGAGGIMVPLGGGRFMLDLMRALGLPVLLVARSDLGTINHTLLSLAALRGAGLDVAGVVMNGPANPGNRAAIEEYGGVCVLAEVGELPDLEPETLRRAYGKLFGE